MNPKPTVHATERRALSGLALAIVALTASAAAASAIPAPATPACIDTGASQAMIKSPSVAWDIRVGPVEVERSDGSFEGGGSQSLLHLDGSEFVVHPRTKPCLTTTLGDDLPAKAPRDPTDPRELPRERPQA